jgi:hypothetical protein
VTGLATKQRTRRPASRHSAAPARRSPEQQRPTRPARDRISLGAAPLVALLAAGGLVLVALGNNAARDAASSAQPLFWGGLALIYAPIALRLLSPAASRAERITLAVLLGAALFMVKVLYSPTGHTPFDELATWRQTDDVLRSGHLLAANPLVLGIRGFPGLEAVTAAVAQLTGLSIFHAGVVVIGLGRVVLMLALFLLLERVTGSARGAGIGIAVYACNPSFLYFDSQFGHESLALPIAAVLLLLAVRWSEPELWDRPRPERGLIGAMAVLACTVTITHHMTSYALLIFFATWAGLTALANREAVQATAGSRAARLRRSLNGPALPALLMAATAGTWFIFVAGGSTMAELGGVFSGTISKTVHLLLGNSGSKTLFAGSGQTNSTLARAIAIGSVIPLLILIPVGLRRTWRRGSSALWRTLALAGLLYPVTLGLRLTQAGTETSQRASEFVFLGLAFFAALVIDEMRWRGWFRRSAKGLVLTALATMVFLGGLIIAQLPATRQPGPFLVGAEARSMSPQGVEAARFAASNLPAGSRILVDRSNATLLGSYGHLDPVLANTINGIPVARVFFSKTFDRADRRVIVDDAIDYIVVDRRLGGSLPVIGYYFTSGEPGAYTRTEPIGHAALDKFRHVPGISRVFANSAITIYDTSGLLRPR